MELKSSRKIALKLNLIHSIIFSASIIGMAESFLCADLAAEEISLRLRPMALLYGIPGAELQAEITPHLEAGPSFHYSGLNDSTASTDLQISETGFRVTGLFWGELNTSGWFTTGALYYYENLITHEEQGASVRFGQLGTTWTLGRQWMLDSLGEDWGRHVNVRLGGGVGYKPRYQSTVVSGGQSFNFAEARRLDPTLEFTIGVLL